MVEALTEFELGYAAAGPAVGSAETWLVAIGYGKNSAALDAHWRRVWARGRAQLAQVEQTKWNRKMNLF